MSRVIFHIDMNAYFASVAKANRSDLENVPIAVSNSLANNGMIVSPCYEARKLGIKAAMMNKDAYRLCPHLIIVETDFELYKQYTKKIFQLIKEFSIYLEPASIDECYLDVTNVIKKFKRPLDLAMLIQNRLLDELNIPCSIGVASNKFLAKMASDMQKPLGITVLRKNELSDKLWHLPIEEMYGVGKKTAEKLIQNQITTIHDLTLEKNYQKIRSIIGPYAETLILNAKGFDQSPLSYNETLQSISQSKTYTKVLENEESIIAELKLMLQKISEKAKYNKVKGKHLSLMFRYQSGKSMIRSLTLEQLTDDYTILLENILRLFDKFYELEPVKLLGCGLGSLVSKEKEIQQLTIFDYQPDFDIKTLLNHKLNTNLIYLNELKEK